MSGPWTEEQITQLIDLWNSGLSAGLIGKRMGKTRNAIIGKIGRIRKDKRVTRVMGEQPYIALCVLGTGNVVNKITKRAHSAVTNAVVSRVYYRNSGVLITPQWPTESVDKLIAYWKRGDSEGTIAILMDKSLPSIRAKLDHLRDYNLIERKTKPKRTGSNFIDTSPAKGVTNLFEFEKAMPQKGVGILDLKFNSCRFPTGGDRSSLLYCGEPKEVGSYCRCHALRAYTSPPTRQVEGRAA